MGSCNHVKKYEKVILLCDPPLHPWSCAKCGEKGKDRTRESVIGCDDSETITK